MSVTRFRRQMSLDSCRMVSGKEDRLWYSGRHTSELRSDNESDRMIQDMSSMDKEERYQTGLGKGPEIVRQEGQYFGRPLEHVVLVRL